MAFPPKNCMHEQAIQYGYISYSFLRLESCNKGFDILNKVVSRNIGAGVHKIRVITNPLNKQVIVQ